MQIRLPALPRSNFHGESRSASRAFRTLLAALAVACTLLLPVSSSFAHDRGGYYGHRGHPPPRAHYGERYRGWRGPGWWGPRDYRPLPPPPPPAWRYYHPHHHRWYCRY